MKKVFNEIIEKLEEQKSGLTEWAEDEAFKLATDKAIEIVKQEAEKYNNGWIPCSLRLPENISTVILQVKEIEKPTFGWYGNITGWKLTEEDFLKLKDFTVVAWQPLPQPYQPKGE